MHSNVGLPPRFPCAKPPALPVLEESPQKPRAFCGFSAPFRRPVGPWAAIVRGNSGLSEVAMSNLLVDYLPLVIFIAVALVIGLVLLATPFVVAYSQPDPEKLSAYECGFNAFDDARMKFDVRFYLVAILFIIFDLEVSFLFPWAVAFRQIGHFGFWAMMLFLGVLTVGFIYEWKKGALEWD
jgi:NADH-quinone oxidoreductase subunit A